jgi:hypothetical protein
MKAFYVPVSSIKEAAKIMEVLAQYDQFQFDNRIKPDYCNMGGLDIYDNNADGEGNPGWVSWEDEKTGITDPAEYIKHCALNKKTQRHRGAKHEHV